MNCVYDVFGSLTLIIFECVLSHGSLRLDINKSRPVCLRQESVYEAVMINLTVKYTAISSCLDSFFSSARRKWPRTRKSNRCGWSQWSVCVSVQYVFVVPERSRGFWIIEWLCCVSVPRWAGTGLRCRVFVCHMSTAPHWGAAYTVLHPNKRPRHSAVNTTHTYTHVRRFDTRDGCDLPRVLEILKALFIFLFSAGISCLRPLQGPLLSLAAHLRVTPWHPAQYILLHHGSYPETPSPEAPSSWRSRPSTAAGNVPPCRRSLPPPCWPFCCPTSSVKYLILSFFVCSLSMSFLLTVMYIFHLLSLSFGSLFIIDWETHLGIIMSTYICTNTDSVIAISR